MSENLEDRREARRRKRQQEAEDEDRGSLTRAEVGSMVDQRLALRRRERQKQREAKNADNDVPEDAERRRRERRESRLKQNGEAAQEEDTTSSRRSRRRQEQEDESEDTTSYRRRRNRGGDDNEEAESKPEVKSEPEPQPEPEREPEPEPEESAPAPAQDEDDSAAREEAERRRRQEEEEADAERQRQEDERRRRQEEERRQLEERRKRGSTTPRQERQSRPKQRTPRGPMKTPRSARQQVCSGFLSARSIPEEDTKVNQENGLHSDSFTVQTKTSSSVSVPSTVHTSEVSTANVKLSTDAITKHNRVLAAHAQEPDLSQLSPTQEEDRFSKSLDTASAKIVMARKLSDSAASTNRNTTSSLLDTGFSGSFDIRAKIEALEKKTNKKMVLALNVETDEQFSQRAGADQKACATLVLSPKPSTPPSHRSIQVVSQTPRGEQSSIAATSTTNNTSVRFSPPPRQRSQPDTRVQPARDALWSMKSDTDMDDRLTDIVASNRKMLHSDDTIDRFTDFELGSSYDDIFVAETVEHQRQLKPEPLKYTEPPFSHSAKTIPAEEKAKPFSTSQAHLLADLNKSSSNDSSESASVQKQPKSILKTNPRESSAHKDSSLTRQKNLATQRERDLRRSTSRGRHNTPSRMPYPESSTTSSSDTDDGHFIPFTTERDDVLRDPRSGSLKHLPAAAETGQVSISQNASLSPRQGQSHKTPVNTLAKTPIKSGKTISPNLSKPSPHLESMSENESLFSGDDVSARNSVSLATSIEHLSSGTDNDNGFCLDDDGNTNDVTLTLADSTEFDDNDTAQNSSGELMSNIANISDIKTFQQYETQASSASMKATLAVPQEEDHGDSDTLEPISSSVFYGVKSDMPFSSKKRKINNRKSGQKISQMTSIWSKMPLSMNKPPSEDLKEETNDSECLLKEKDTMSLDEHDKKSVNKEQKSKMRKTSADSTYQKLQQESTGATPEILVDAPVVIVNSPECSADHTKSWKDGGAKEKLDELFGKLNSKLKAKGGSSASTSPRDEMFGEQVFDPSVQTVCMERFKEDDQSAEISYDENIVPMQEDYSSPQFLAPFDSSVDAIQRSNSQPILSSRDDMSYYDQSRSIHEYIATDENGTTGKSNTNAIKTKTKPSETSPVYWENPGTPRIHTDNGGKRIDSESLYSKLSKTKAANQEDWAESFAGGASTSSSGQRGGTSNLSNRSTINSDSDYDAEELDPLNCAAEYDYYRNDESFDDGDGCDKHMSDIEQRIHHDQFVLSTGFNISSQASESDVARKESIISVTSNISTASNQGSVSAGSYGNIGRASQGNRDLLERRVHTEEWLVEDARLRKVSPRASSADPSTASSIADSMSAATAGSECEIDEEDLVTDTFGGEEGFCEERMEEQEFGYGYGFFSEETGEFFYHGEEQGYSCTSASQEKDDLKLELGFLNNSSEDEEEFYDDEHLNADGGEFSSDKCVDGSSHQTYTDSSDEYDEYMNQNDTIMYNEQIPDNYSDESGEIPADIIQTMDELGEDILQYLSDEMEEEGEVEEWGEEDIELHTGNAALKDQFMEQEVEIRTPQTLSDSHTLERGIFEDDGLVFYTPNNTSSGNEKMYLTEKEHSLHLTEDTKNVCQDLVSGNEPTMDLKYECIHADYPFIPKLFNDIEPPQSPLRDRHSDGRGNFTSSQGFGEVMTDSARLREQFKEHHGHIDDKDIVHRDDIPDGRNLPDNDEFFISFEIDEAHRLSYRQYDDNARSPEDAFYEYLQHGDRSGGGMSSDPDSATVFTQDSPLNSFNDSTNRASFPNTQIGTISSTNDDTRHEIQYSDISDSYDANEAETDIDFALKQNLLSEIRSHFENKDIKKKLVAELKHFDFKSLKHLQADLSPNQEPDEVPVMLSPVLPSVVRRLSHENQVDVIEQEFPPKLKVNAERMSQEKQEHIKDSETIVPALNKSDECEIDKKHISQDFKRLILGGTNVDQEMNGTNSVDLDPAYSGNRNDVYIKSSSATASICLSSSNQTASSKIIGHEPAVTREDDKELSSAKPFAVDTHIYNQPAIHTEMEVPSFKEDKANASPLKNAQVVADKESFKKRRSSVDGSENKLTLSKERRRSIRSFWEQLDDEKQKKKEEEENWHRRKSNNVKKQQYRSQSLTTDDGQPAKNQRVDVSGKDGTAKVTNRDALPQINAKKPPPPPVAPKPARSIVCDAEPVVSRKDPGLIVKKIAEFHESSDSSHNRRARRKAEVHHSELAVAIMKRQKELAQQNLVAAASSNSNTCHSEPMCNGTPILKQNLSLALNKDNKDPNKETVVESQTANFKESISEKLASRHSLEKKTSVEPVSSNQPTAAYPPPPTPPSTPCSTALSARVTHNATTPEDYTQIDESVTIKPAPVHQESAPSVKTYSAPRPKFNAKTLAKNNTFLPSFARKSHTDIPSSVSSTTTTQPSERLEWNTNIEQKGYSVTSSECVVDPVTTAESETPPVAASREMKSWVADYLKDMIGGKHLRSMELDSFGSRISSESTSMNTSFSANTSFYGHLPMHIHHGTKNPSDWQEESNASPRLSSGCVAKPLTIADRINKIQEKMNTSKDSIKESEQLKPTQSQQQFASLLQNRLIDVIAREQEEGNGENESDKQARSRKPPLNAWALERQRLFGKGKNAKRNEDWGEPDSSSTPTSAITKKPTDPSAQLENLSESLSQSDVVKMSVVRRNRKARRHTAGGTIFDIVEKFNSTDSSSTESSHTPIERTRPNSPWVAKTGVFPQTSLVPQLVNRLSDSNTADSDKAGNKTPAEPPAARISSNDPTNTTWRNEQRKAVDPGGVISGTFDKNIMTELLKKVELSGDESGSTSLSNSSSFQTGTLRKHSLDGSKIAELKLKLTSESRSSSNSSLSHLQEHRSHNSGESGVRTIVTRLESPLREMGEDPSSRNPMQLLSPASLAYPPTHATSTPERASIGQVISTGKDTSAELFKKWNVSSNHTPPSPAAPKNKRLYNERRHTTQVNFDELREKYNSMALRRELQPPPQSKALWAIDAASSRLENKYLDENIQVSQSNRYSTEPVSAHFEIAQSSIFSKTTGDKKPCIFIPPIIGSKKELHHGALEDALPTEPESPLMTSSARQPPALTSAYVSLQHASAKQNAKGSPERIMGIKELDTDDVVYSPLSSARVPEAYNLPLDVVPTPDPWVASDHFQKDMSFGELAESESSDTFEFLKKRSEIKEEFLLRKEKEMQLQQIGRHCENERTHYHSKEQQQSEFDQFNRKHSLETFQVPNTHCHYQEQRLNNNCSSASFPSSQPLRYNFPETIIDTRTATGHVVCRVLAEKPLEPDESGIGGSDNSLGSGSVSASSAAFERDRAAINPPFDRTSTYLVAPASPTVSNSGTVSVCTANTITTISQNGTHSQALGEGVHAPQQQRYRRSQDDTRRKLSLGTNLMRHNEHTQSGDTSPRRASIHDIHSQQHFSSTSLSPSILTAPSSNNTFARSATHLQPVVHSGTASISSLSSSSVVSIPPSYNAQEVTNSEAPGIDSHSSNPSPTPASHNLIKGDNSTKSGPKKEKHRRSKSKFMQEIEKKRNYSEPTGKGTDAFEHIGSNRRANSSSTDPTSAHLKSLEEDTFGNSKAIFGPSVARKKSTGAADGIEGMATSNTMRGYSKRFDRLWAKFDPDQPQGSGLAEGSKVQSGSEHAHENGNYASHPISQTTVDRPDAQIVSVLKESVGLSDRAVVSHKEEEERQRQEEEEAERKRMEAEEAERIKAEEESKKKKGGKRKGLGGLSAEKKKLLKKLIMQKAAEDLRNEAMQKAAEKEKYINDRVPLLKTEGLGQSELEKLVKDLHSKVSVLEEEVYDWEIKIRKQDFEINELTLKVNDTKGKFMKPVLRKVNKTESKLKKQKTKESTDFRGNLRSTGQNKFALDEEEPESNNPHWRDGLKPKDKEDADAVTQEAES